MIIIKEAREACVALIGNAMLLETKETTQK